MKKIGIITINDYKNYGNRLQNYASQEVLKSLGYSPETIVNIQKKKIQLNTTNPIGDRLKKLTIKKIIRKIYNKLKYNPFYYKRKNKYNDLKEKNFRDFTNKHIIESNFIISEGSYHEKLNKFDCFIVGSDQVWNPNYRSGSSIDFLTFAPVNKRVSYAASFGISNIPESYTSLYKEWLSDFSALSVREEVGVSIIKQLTGRDADVLIDPTLMLTKQQWLNISNPPLNKPKKQFILTYFLGEKNRDTKSYIKNISNKYNLDVYNMADLSDSTSYVQSPSEFIDLISDATLVITDSFHGCVFSIIFEKPFIVFKRDSGKNNSMNSRIETLLTKFNLDSCLIENVIDDHILEIDYSNIRSILDNEKIKALNFLKKALP